MPRALHVSTLNSHGNKPYEVDSEGLSNLPKMVLLGDREAGI